MTLERVERRPDAPASLAPKADAAKPTLEATPSSATAGATQYEKITTAKMAAKLGMTTKAFQERLVELGMLELHEGGRHYLVEAGKDAGDPLCSAPPSATRLTALMFAADCSNQ